MTTTPLNLTIAPHCTITSCWSEDVHELHDKHGRVIAHYCPDHKTAVVALRQSTELTLCQPTTIEVSRD